MMKVQRMMDFLSSFHPFSQKKNDYPLVEFLMLSGVNLDGNDDPVCKTGKKTQMYITDFWTQRERERVG